MTPEYTTSSVIRRALREAPVLGRGLRLTLVLAMVQRPKLIERPIVVTGGKAAVGRPPENVLSIL